MVNSVKALILILPMIIGTFVLAQMIFRDIVAPQRMAIWRNIFILITLICFLVPNFWLMIACVAFLLIVIIFARIETNLPALFMLLVCALPPRAAEIPGIGGINYFFALSPQMLMQMIILGAALMMTSRIFAKSRGGLSTDAFMALYAFMVIALAFRDTSLTDGLRAIWMLLITVLLPYLIFSRWPKSPDEIRVMVVALVVPVAALALSNIPEVILSWHFYAMPAERWHGYLLAGYLERGGLQRAYASTLGPIVWGYVVMVAMTYSYTLFNRGPANLLVAAGILCLAGGLLLSFSRGPWMGATIATALYVLTGPKGLSRGMMVGAASVIGLAFLAITPLGNKIFGFLPFFGGEIGESENLDYRARLFENGMRVIRENPLFGSTNYLEHPLMVELFQGQGIIDLVNTYIQVGLGYGFVGIFLFVMILASALWSALRAQAMTRQTDPQFSAIARAGFASMVGMMAVIATMSNVYQVEIFYWTFAGLCVGMRRVAETASAPQAQTTAIPENQPTENDAYSPAMSMRAAREQQRAARETARAAMLADGFDAKKRAALRKSLPPHLRQYVGSSEDKG